MANKLLLFLVLQGGRWLPLLATLGSQQSESDWPGLRQQSPFHTVSFSNGSPTLRLGKPTGEFEGSSQQRDSGFWAGQTPQSVSNKGLC